MEELKKEIKELKEINQKILDILIFSNSKNKNSNTEIKKSEMLL